MNVGDVMSREVEFIGQEASAQDAAELMGEIDVGALPVGTADRLHGIVTDRDLLYRVVAKGLDPVSTRLRDIASRPVITCRSSDTLHSAMDAMAANHVRRMPVQDPETSMIVGWVTLADISRTLLVGSGELQQALRAMTEA
ncbi:MAG: CBS domain-containing protein [Alphaproteobacteria bacterium]|nr:MAG: CBS domain-containing protein [Alphaproteobacteria bacterium]